MKNKTKNTAANEEKLIKFFLRVEPAVYTTNGVALFQQIKEEIEKYVYITPAQSTCIALYVLFTYFVHQSNVAPILLLTSPTKRCGKTTTLSILRQLVSDPFPVIDITPAALFRFTDQYHPTLLLDEADAIKEKINEMRVLFNAGHARHLSMVPRCQKDTGATEFFDVFGARILASIGALPDTIMDRSIKLDLIRKPSDMQTHDLNSDIDLSELKSMIIRWCQDNEDNFKSIKLHRIKLGNNRAEDNWMPLLTLAVMLDSDKGSVVYDQAHKAAHLLAVNEDDTDNEDLNLLLLKDVYNLLQDHEYLPTMSIINSLHEMELRPYSEMNLKPQGLARRLKNFGIRPTRRTVTQDTTRVYVTNQFRQPRVAVYLDLPANICANDPSNRPNNNKNKE